MDGGEQEEGFGLLMQERGLGWRKHSACQLCIRPIPPSSSSLQSVVLTHPEQQDLSIHSALVSIFQPSPGFFFHCSSPVPSIHSSIHPHPQTEPSSPQSSWNRSCLGFVSVPAQRGTERRGGAPAKPGVAAQPHPFTHGRGIAQDRPSTTTKHLTLCLCHPSTAQQLWVSRNAFANLHSKLPSPTPPFWIKVNS